MSRALFIVVVSAALVAGGCAPSDQMAEDAAADATSQVSQSAGSSRGQDSAQPGSGMVKVPKGTRIQIAFDDKLSSGSNVPGDAFVATVVEDVVRNGAVRIPEGSRIRGTIQEVKKAKRGAGEASMTLKFEQLDMSRGFSAPIVAGFSESTESKKKRNAAVIGGSAAGGALVGRVLGKDTKSAVVGGLVGGAIGTGVILAKPGEQVEIPAGSQAEIKLNQPVSVPVR